MKGLLNIALVSAFLLFCGSTMAQDYPKRTIDGQEYFVYHVEPGNTLFAIARAFSADVNAIKRANPGAAEGLNIGQEILVPITAIDRKEARRTDVRTEGEHLLHTVQRKETLFSISRLYGVSVKDITELNPGAAETLSTGVVLTIPVQRSSTVKEAYLEPARNDTFTVHQVERGETAFSIAKKYEITVDSLYKFNPGANAVLSTGAWLVIPKYNEEFLAQRQSAGPVGPGGNLYNLNGGTRETYHVAILLPFEVALNDSIGKKLQQGQPLHVLTEISLEFYRGARLALDSLSRLGFNAEVSVIELADDVVAARDVLKRKELQEVDLIIGPMHKTSLALVSEFAHKKQVYLVSPNNFTNDVLRENPYLFRATASGETMIKYLANYVAINHDGHNVLMVSSELAKDWPLRELFKQNYNEALGTFPNAFHDSVVTVTRKSFSGDNVPTWLRKDTLNVLVVPSNELAFISDFTTRLLTLSRAGYRIQVYGLEQWTKFDGIDTDYKNRLKMRLVVPNHIDYDSPRVVDFLTKFRDSYHTEPTRMGYGFQGYDLTMFFGKALLQKGMSFGSKADELSMDGVMGNYRFGRTSAGKDFENKSVLIIEYNDFAIKRIN